MDQSKQPGIQVTQIFLERAVFAHREDFLEFPPDSPVSPNVECALQSGLSPDRTKGIVRVRVRTVSEEPSLYQVELSMSALVEKIEGQENFELETYLKSNGWALLFPFVRETLANLTGRGRFGPIWMNPVNVLALVDASAVANTRQIGSPNEA